MMHYNNCSWSERPITKLGGVLLIFFIFSTFHVCLGQNKEATQEELAKYYPKKVVTSVELLAGPSYVYGRSIDYLDGKIAFSGGIRLTHDFNARLKIYSNILFELKGYKQELKGVVIDSTGTKAAKSINELTLNYFSLSLTPAYEVIDDKLSIGLGPYAAYLSSSKYYQENYVNGVISSIYKRNLKPNELYKEYDFGLTFCLLYKVIYKSHSGYINLFYNLGLFDINQPRVTDFKNNSLSLLLSYQIFNLKK